MPGVPLVGASVLIGIYISSRYAESAGIPPAFRHGEG
jgi:hypothetical protein